MSAAPSFTDAELAACAEREVRQRRRVYPRLIRKGSMTTAEADHETAMMKAIGQHFGGRVAEQPQNSGRLL